MILALDIGNSNIVLSVMKEDEILFVARLATETTKTADQYAIEIKDILHLYGINILGITGSIISCVVPPLSHTISCAVMKVTNTRSLLVGPGVKTGLNIRMENTSQVGADLVTVAVAAIAEYPDRPLIIIDMGTATTVSVISRDGSLIGGSILPGVLISLSALTSKTAQLPSISLESPKTAIGKNTPDAMLAGSIYGAAGSVDFLVSKIEEELGEKALILATGGFSQYIIRHCKTEIAYDADLLMKGLRIIYRKNN